MIDIQALQSKPPHIQKRVQYAVIAGIMALVLCGWILYMRANAVESPLADSTAQVKKDAQSFMSVFKDMRERFE